MTKLTKPQQRYLDEIRASGEKRYNGRARRTVKALEGAGLITVEYDQNAHVKGGGIEITEVFICRPVVSND